MKRRAFVGGIALLVSATVAVAPGVTPPAGAQVPSGTRLIPAAGTTNIRSQPQGVEGIQQPEIRVGADPDEGDAPETDMAAAAPQGEAGQFNRPDPRGPQSNPFPRQPLDAPHVQSSALAASDAAVSVLGLNHRDQRLANGGNQFSLEPPDQGLCVGNGFVVEAINSVIRVYNRNGAPLTGVQDLNTFLGYPAAINRTTGVIGPQVID